MPDGSRASALHTLDDLPHVPKLPLIGSLPWLLHRDGFMWRMLELSERHRATGAFRVSMPHGESPAFFCNASFATDIADEARFEKVLVGPLLQIREFGGDGLFTARSDEPNWHLAHRILSPGFSTASLERYYPAMTDTLETLLGHWRRSDARVDVVLDMTKMTLDTISLAGFDYRFESFARPTLHPFLQALGRVLQESVDILRRPPLLAPLFRRRRAQQAEDIASMFALVDQVIRERRKKPESDWPADFLSLMLSEADPKTGQKLSDENIRYQILTFLVAGHETTAGLLSYTLHQLARDPALFSRLRAEVDAAAPTGMPSMKTVLELDLVRRTLSETLRLWPTVPAIMRAPKQDTVIGDGLRVPAGVPLTLLIHAVHRDPAVWPDPARFDPDRFLPEAVKARPSAAYKPFGIGKRACTGRHFALIEATLCLAVLVREFDLFDPGPLAQAATASPKPKAFLLRVVPRRR